jgi:hypothetical protein
MLERASLGLFTYMLVNVEFGLNGTLKKSHYEYFRAINANSILDGNPKEKRPLVRLGERWITRK